jgi:hypothetical protein
MGARQMLEKSPTRPSIDMEALAAAIDTCFECAEVCTACSDACLGEGNLAELGCCVTCCASCADICNAAGRVLARQVYALAAMTRAAVVACIDSCRACADECASHEYAHCQLCAETCRRCVDVCGKVLSSLAG